MTTVAHIITKLELGGAQQNTLYTVGHLNIDKYQRVILCYGPGGVLENIENLPPENIEISQLPQANSFVRYRIPTLIRQINPIKDWKAFQELKRIFKEEKVDIVHTHSSKAGILGRWAAKFAGVPIIIHTFHGFGFNDYQKPWIKYFFIFLERLTAKITNKLVAVSKENVKKGLYYNIGKPEQYAVIHSGIKFENFWQVNVNIEEKKKELGINVNSGVVGMVACFKPQKAPEDFIKMANIVAKQKSDTQFLLVGDGELRSQLERLIKTYKLESKVILAGWRTDIPEIISILDVFVLTSLWEGLPRVILESFICRKPVVVTNIDGINEIVRDDENGFLFSPHDIKGMAEKVIFLLENKEKAKKMGEKGGNLIIQSSFNIDVMVREIEALYEAQFK